MNIIEMAIVTILSTNTVTTTDISTSSEYQMTPTEVIIHKEMALKNSNRYDPEYAVNSISK